MSLQSLTSCFLLLPSSLLGHHPSPGTKRKRASVKTLGVQPWSTPLSKISSDFRRVTSVPSYINFWGTCAPLGRQNKSGKQEEDKTPSYTQKLRKTEQMGSLHGTGHPRRNRSSLEVFTCASPDLGEAAVSAGRLSGGFACRANAKLCLTKLREKGTDVGVEILSGGAWRCLGSWSFCVSRKPC